MNACRFFVQKSIDKVMEKYRDEEIVLSADDFEELKIKQEQKEKTRIFYPKVNKREGGHGIYQHEVDNMIVLNNVIHDVEGYGVFNRGNCIIENVIHNASGAIWLPTEKNYSDGNVSVAIVANGKRMAYNGELSKAEELLTFFKRIDALTNIAVS